MLANLQARMLSEFLHTLNFLVKWELVQAGDGDLSLPPVLPELLKVKVAKKSTLQLLMFSEVKQLAL
jgi:hypothetical protein